MQLQQDTQNKEIKKQNELLEAIRLMQNNYFKHGMIYGWCEETLKSLLLLTDSKFGFICELMHKKDGTPYLKSHIITNLAWNDETRQFYNENKEKGLEFFNFKSIWGQVFETGKPYISDDPDTDQNKGGYPKESGHPQLKKFLGIPIKGNDNKVLGIMAVANNPNGYNHEVVRYLEPFVSTYGILLEQERFKRVDKKREQEVIEAKEIAEERELRLDYFFNQATAGAFFMMLDEPVFWNDSVDKKKVLDYVFEKQRITKVNQAMLEQYTTTEKDFIGQTFKDFFAHDLKYGKGILKELLDKGKLHIDTNERRGDGSQIWVLGDYICMYDTQGRITGHFGLQIDITDRKKAEQALKESESNLKERNKELNGIYKLGILSERFNNLEDIYSEFVNLIAPKSMQFPEKTVVLLEIEGKKHCNIENFNLGKNKTYLTAPIIVFDNKIGELIVTYTEDLPFIDVFEQNLINNYAGRISKIKERIETLITIKENEKKLVQLNANKDRFISILAHDLRSPFNSLLGLSKRLTKNIHKYDIDKIENIAISINKSAQRSFNLLDDLLNWANAQEGNIQYKPENLSLTDVCNDVLITLNPTANEKNITLNYSVKDQLNVFADIDMLKTVLRNLVSNAIKFTDKGGKINISAEQTDSNVTISVSDNGVGIPPENLEKLFDISKVITTEGTANEKGTGLGLLLCKEFVEKHGGKIWVESEEGNLPAGKAGGSEFKFTLPCNAEKKLI